MLGYQLISAIETKRRKNFKEKVVIAEGWEGSREGGTGREGCELPEHVCCWEIQRGLLEEQSRRRGRKDGTRHRERAGLRLEQGQLLHCNLREGRTRAQDKKGLQCWGYTGIQTS